MTKTISWSTSIINSRSSTTILPGLAVNGSGIGGTDIYVLAEAGINGTGGGGDGGYDANGGNGVIIIRAYIEK